MPLAVGTSGRLSPWAVTVISFDGMSRATSPAATASAQCRNRYWSYRGDPERSAWLATAIRVVWARLALAVASAMNSRVGGQVDAVPIEENQVEQIAAGPRGPEA